MYQYTLAKFAGNKNRRASKLSQRNYYYDQRLPTLATAVLSIFKMRILINNVSHGAKKNREKKHTQTGDT